MVLNYNKNKYNISDKKVNLKLKLDNLKSFKLLYNKIY